MDDFCAAEYIQNLQVKGSKFGFERERKLLDLLDSPDNMLKIIHVAGTNGKGSVCAYITAVLLAAGKTVGTFTSPAVFEYEEQYRVNGKSSALLTEKYLKKAICAAQSMADSPTAFEIETAAALLMFREEGCEYAVIECGLGGLNDSTNAVNKKSIAVINSISLEHTAVLGSTLIEIATQKAGIIRDCPAVVNALQSPEVLKYLRDIGGVIADTPQILSSGLNGCIFTCGGETYEICMHGREQAYNAATAIKACEMLCIDKSAIKAGLKAAKLDGRIEIINSDKTYILDGAHNPASFYPLTEFVSDNFEDKKITIIYGCLSDKDSAECLRVLSRLNADITAVTPNSYRAKPSEEVYVECKKYFAQVTQARSVEDALENAMGGVVIICGSFTLLKEAKQWIGKRQ